MGTKVQCKGYSPGYYSMRDLNEDSNSCSWSLYYGDQKLSNGQYYNGFLPRTVSDACDKDAVKRTMLEHEAIFKTQVHELHRLYRTQRDLMDEVKRKELHHNRISMETLFSSRTLASQMPHEGVQKCLDPSFPLASIIDPRSSVSGADADFSPLNSVREKNVQGSPFQSQNGGSSRNSDVLESRPTKVRRKLLDLQLPADEYIDTEQGEPPQDNVSVKSIYQGNSPESGEKLSYSNGGKCGGQVNVLQSGSGSKRTDCVADLNEPVQVEDTDDSTTGGPLGHGFFDQEVRVKDLSTKPKSYYLGFPKEAERGSISHMLEAGHGENILTSISQGLPPEKMYSSLQSMQHLLGKGHDHPHRHIPNDKDKVDMWRGRSISGFEFSKEDHKISNKVHSAGRSSTLASRVPSLYSVGQSSDKSWSNGVSSWEKLCGEWSQKTIPTHPCFSSSSHSLGTSSQPAVQSHEIFGDWWNFSRSNQSFETDSPNQNGFYLGSSSGSKKRPSNVPSLSYNYLKGSGDLNADNEHLTSHGSKKVYNGLHYLDSRSEKDLNLNAEPQNNSADENIPLRSPEMKDLERKHEDHPAALPWVRAKPYCKQEKTGVGRDSKSGLSSCTNSSLNHLWSKNETEKGSMHYYVTNIKSASCANSVEAKRTGTSDYQRTQKILGVPIFDKTQGLKNEPLHCSSDCGDLADNRKSRLFDINLPCEPTADLSIQKTEEKQCVKKEGDTAMFSFRHQIDLNSCASEENNSVILPVPRTNEKVIVEIDLEVPAVPESEEEDIVHREEPVEKQHEEPPTSTEERSLPLLDELVKVAAEAIVCISSLHPDIQIDDKTYGPLEASVADPLYWFAEIASACGDDIDTKLDAVLRGKGSEPYGDSSSEEIDYFEYMTLKLIEVTEEEYMPMPLVPENIKMEETGASFITKRPRRGQARRGRQRKDFQRDILPGLVSLSRHEVAEDLQTFGGLMRAMGYSWQSRLARRNSTRNGCARGRRRLQDSPPPAAATNAACAPLMQQLNFIEDRSLTGWGKTTRRPRRQRCPAGNPPSLPVT